MAENDPKESFDRANEAQDQFNKKFRENTEFLRDAFTSLGFQIQATIENAINSTEQLNNISKKVAESYSRDIFNAVKSYNRNLDQSITLQIKAQQGLLSQKDIQNAQLAIQAKSEAIKQRIDLLQNSEIKLTKAQQKQLGELNKELEVQENIAQKQLETIQKTNDEVIKNQSIYVKLGNVLTQNANKIDKSGTLAKVLKGNFKDTISEANILEMSLLGVLKAVLSTSSQMATLRKELGISYQNSYLVANEFRLIANLSGDTFITSEKLTKSFADLSKELGFIVNSSGETLETFTNLTQRLGLSNQAATQLTILAKSQSDSTEVVLQSTGKTVDNLNAQKGTSILLKTIFNDIATANKSIVVSLGMNPKLIAEAATQARQLGLNLQGVDKIADSLLQFETSITNELRAELFLQKNINLEQARFFALTNDLAGLTEEIGKNQEIINAFATNNRVAQQAIAETLGMSREEMAQMVFQQQAQLLGAEAVRAKFGEQAYEQLKSRNAAEKFQDTLTKIQDIIGSFGALLTPVIDAFASIVGYLAESQAAIAGLVGISSALAAKSIVNAVASIFGVSFALGGPLGIGIAAAGVAAMYGAISASKQQVQDGIAKEGPFQITDRYGRMAVTATGDKIAISPNISYNRDSGGDNQLLLQEMRIQNQYLQKLTQKSSDFFIDSDNATSLLRRSAYRI
jgi:hypothetical protein